MTTAKPNPAAGSTAYRAVVAAVRAYARTVDPTDPTFATLVGRVDLIDVVAYSPGGVGVTIAQFHADPADVREHHLDDRQKCPHCRGDRLAEGRGR